MYKKDKEDLFSLLNDIEGNRIGSFYTSEEVRRDVAKKILDTLCAQRNG